MKYNPKINDAVAGLDGFAGIHPYQDPGEVQGALELLYRLDRLLCEITGMRRFTFQPASGAQGEMTGLLMIRKYHDARGDARNVVLVPDSAHGTNPASATLCGCQTVVVPSTPEGLVDLEALRRRLGPDVAAVMMTNPNTLGLFEEEILAIGDLVHGAGGLMYYDGANFNALLGLVQPSRMGFDVIHLNLHKTFSTPHGSGGPGAGAVGVNDRLVDFLPVPLVGREGDRYVPDYRVPRSIGRVRGFYGNFAVLVRAYAYLLRLGAEGLPAVARHAVLNANYLREKLRPFYQLPYAKPCMHEVVFSCVGQKARGASALDVAKRLIDFGVHPPTMYFPQIVKEALMVEPTETESRETLDRFVAAMAEIDREIAEDLEKVRGAPLSTPVRRVDEVRAARVPDLRYREREEKKG
jgi:glycine dehydrogenase subunit 2